jgi:hypothetical protein
MKRFAYWDIIQCSTSKVFRRFGGACLHIQDRRINHARNQNEAGSNRSNIPFLNGLYLDIFLPEMGAYFSFPPFVQFSCFFNSFLFHNHNNIWRRVQIMELPIMLLSLCFWIWTLLGLNICQGRFLSSVISLCSFLIVKTNFVVALQLCQTSLTLFSCS